MKYTIFFLLCLSSFTFSGSLFAEPFPWPRQSSSARRILSIKTPPGFKRKVLPAGSFGGWLRSLPLKPTGTKVHLYNGALKENQTAHYAVIDIDTGRRDLQQCADAVMRLRAEYQLSQGKTRRIRFNFTDGVPARYTLWKRGYRPVVARRRKTRWVRRKGVDASYQNFRRYMTMVFNYAGTYSLSKELPRVRNHKTLRSGDVFLTGGFPGHAVIVVDVALNSRTGQKAFLLAQSYMPAQDMHVLKNPQRKGAWYFVNDGKTLRTPEWDFPKKNLSRFRD